ncbi:hypothetical protein [Poseidonibacter ostreae]|jgi:hypothetical protein|uniref:Uncharacterized protein n=1 Tax=Poseidonibacter ostreae TaxID=2654171 RepID=A0A6L4WWF4_9BACT|nr:hypothetical protein [Poseidonibacter ostreae]KAB7888011.1 hypothetical protein GA417_01220 [Poseidonibacter ostreae]KAB7891070.1 hypothetical protein GBG19_01515 [Poseidonibacter ostreae]KAB7892794.1 hypothetical protein GBG18_01225 [Poseidonibacter ostreae]MAD40767.1 hypothetical protein [Arcobacter sp.]|tara:strand:- start:6813 stop:7193 length:381 start_codon:yes stop_codon:yes gene_type:complete
MKVSRLLIVAFFAVFMLLGIMALKQGMPSAKDQRVYPILQKHMPYVLEKRAGGLSIRSKITDIKEKPPAKDVYGRLEQLEKQWGKEFLKLEGMNLSILDKNKNEITKIVLQNDTELSWVKSYFELK